MVVPEHGGSLAQLESALESRLPALLTEVGVLLERGWPEYARFLEDDRDEVAQAGALFVHRLLSMARQGLSYPAEPSEAEGVAQAVFEHVGRVQCQHGQDLTNLLTAYQVGARAAWRHVSATALELRLEPDVLAALAEAVFVFVNELSSASAHGYVVEQSESSIARERLREELSELLLSDRSDMQAIRAAADRAAWSLPSEAAVVLVDPEDETARRVLHRLEPRGLPVRRPAMYGLILADPAGPGGTERLRRALRGAGAVVGHPVPLDLLPRSTRIAEIAARLKHEGLLAGDPIFASEHLDTIIVQRDQRLIGALRTRALDPLSGLPEGTRERLTATLTSWLAHMGDRHAVADELHIHPQTVRYRLGQLRERFGTDLDEPRSRARLLLALLWEPDGD